MRTTSFPDIFPTDAEGSEISRDEARARRHERRAKRAAARPPELATNPLQRVWFEDQAYFRRLCLRWTAGNTHDAEDVMGQVCVKVLEAAGERADAVRNPRAWIARVMHNLCVDSGRASERSRVLAETEVAAPNPSPPPDLGVSRIELVDALTEAVRRLPNHLREVVILRLVEEQSYEDICGALDISIPNARKRLQQARALLRPNLESYWVERLEVLH